MANAINQVIEGKRNAQLVIQLAQKHAIDMPICEMVWNVVEEKMSPSEAMQHLLSREPTEEV